MMKAARGERVSLKQASEMLGVSKTTARKYLNEGKIPFSMEDGIYSVLKSDVAAYKERHPEIGRASSLKNVDREPVSGNHHEKPLLTVAEAAALAGYTASGIRMMIKNPHAPLPVERNAEGWALIDQDVLSAYLETRGATPEPDALKPVSFAGYPELENLPGTYQSPSKIADALGLPKSTVYSWVKDPVNPPPHINNGKRPFINKNKLVSWLEQKEAAGKVALPA